MKISGIWLAPLAFMYGLITSFRNYLYNIGYSRSFNYDIMVIAVGNLSAGGTGKSPMTEYLLRLLHATYSLATLSRGYKRKSKGFLIADKYTGVEEIGDEPYQMYLKYNRIAKIAVGEERSIAIPNILLEHPETQVIIMDDGFQHRTVTPDLSILLTDYQHLFYSDHLLPMGRLRETKKGARRAHAVVVTKCPGRLSNEEELVITRKIRKYAGKDMPVFFSKIVYHQVLCIDKKIDSPPGKVIAFAGLANTELFSQYIDSNFTMAEMVSFKDHHHYSREDIKMLVDKAVAAGADLITTEKDVVKFRNRDNLKLLRNIPLYYLSIEHQFVKNGNVFDKLVLDAITEKYIVEE
jgi:tetraacyldisaccharide 4'-kinase